MAKQRQNAPPRTVHGGLVVGTAGVYKCAGRTAILWTSMCSTRVGGACRFIKHGATYTGRQRHDLYVSMCVVSCVQRCTPYHHTYAVCSSGVNQLYVALIRTPLFFRVVACYNLEAAAVRQAQCHVHVQRPACYMAACAASIEAPPTAAYMLQAVLPTPGRSLRKPQKVVRAAGLPWVIQAHYCVPSVPPHSVHTAQVTTPG